MKIGDFIEINGVTFEVVELRDGLPYDYAMVKCISMDSPLKMLHRVALPVLYELLGSIHIKIYTEEEKIEFLERMLKRNVWNIRGDD